MYPDLNSNKKLLDDSAFPFIKQWQKSLLIITVASLCGIFTRLPMQSIKSMYMLEIIIRFY